MKLNRFLKTIFLAEFISGLFIAVKEIFKEATTNDPTCSLANYSLFWTAFLSSNEVLKKDGDKAINAAISHLYKLPPIYC